MLPRWDKKVRALAAELVCYIPDIIDELAPGMLKLLLRFETLCSVRQPRNPATVE